MKPSDYVRKLKRNTTPVSSSEPAKRRNTPPSEPTEAREALPDDPYSYPSKTFLYHGDVLSTDEADLLYSKQMDDDRGRAFMFRCRDGREFLVAVPFKQSPQQRSLFYAAAFSGSFAMFIAHFGAVMGFFFPLAVLTLFYGFHEYHSYDRYGEAVLQDVWEPDTPFESSFIRSFEQKVPEQAIDSNGNPRLKPRPLKLHLNGYGDYAFTENFVRLYNQRYL